MSFLTLFLCLNKIHSFTLITNTGEYLLMRPAPTLTPPPLPSLATRATVTLCCRRCTTAGRSARKCSPTSSAATVNARTCSPVCRTCSTAYTRRSVRWAR